MLDDFVKSIKAALYDRTASPLFGAFAISWLVWNYKLLVLLFSDVPAPIKFALIDATLYPNGWAGLLHLALGPALTAAAFLFGYPYPARFVYRFWRQRQSELREIRRQIEDATPLTLEESRRVRRQIIEIQTEYEGQIRSSSAEVTRLKEALVEQQRVLEHVREEAAAPKAVATSDQDDGIRAAHDEITAALLSVPYRLHFNPPKGRAFSKVMVFGPRGRILEGANANETSWRLDGNRLELVQADGGVHSRFVFHPTSSVFTHTNDADTRSIRGQYLVPEPDAAKTSGSSG